MIIDEHLQREAYLAQAVFARRRASAGLRPEETGMSKAAKMAIMAITTSSSTKLNAFRMLMDVNEQFTAR